MNYTDLQVLAMKECEWCHGTGSLGGALLCSFCAGMGAVDDKFTKRAPEPPRFMSIDLEEAVRPPGQVYKERKHFACVMRPNDGQQVLTSLDITNQKAFLLSVTVATLHGGTSTVSTIRPPVMYAVHYSDGNLIVTRVMGETHVDFVLGDHNGSRWLHVRMNGEEVPINVIIDMELNSVS